VTPDKDDRRGRRLIITSQGRALLAQALTIWKSTHAKIEALLPSERDADRLRADLKSLG